MKWLLHWCSTNSNPTQKNINAWQNDFGAYRSSVTGLNSFKIKVITDVLRFLVVSQLIHERWRLNATLKALKLCCLKRIRFKNTSSNVDLINYIHQKNGRNMLEYKFITRQETPIRLTEPMTTALVYFIGRHAASPYTLFWYTPLAPVSRRLLTVDRD